MLKRLVHSVQSHIFAGRIAVRGLHSSGALQNTTDDAHNSTGIAQQELQSGLPDVMPETDEGGGPSLSEEEMKRRKSKAVMSWLEEQVGKEKVEVTKLLQRHNVIVRGGPEEGRRLLDALVEWKQRGQ